MGRYGETELAPASFISGLRKLRFQGNKNSELRTPDSSTQDFRRLARRGLAPLRLTAYSS
jgi:hypothetical protein